ncbi:MAG: hypothetical protein GF416_02950 [Candidatus Altiarchaeales archaeon]|nr:hypothetical protein [Candidatus Altiarchaeales archaeon]MBD3416078.1 hypothetical protein [Candidatus Altiarchaeales archaeon]
MRLLSLSLSLVLLFSGCVSQGQQGGTAEDSAMRHVPDEGGADGSPGVVRFSLTGVNYRFLMDGVENPTLRVRQGDTVRVEFTSAEGFHDWVVDEFDAATDKVSAPASTYVEFVADKKGSFEYYCSVGQHRQQGMEGELIVE